MQETQAGRRDPKLNAFPCTIQASLEAVFVCRAPMKTNVALAIVILAIAAIPRQAAEPIGRHGWWVGI